MHSQNKYNSIMSKWLAETEFMQNITKDLLQGRQEYYSQETITLAVLDHPSLSKRHLTTKNVYGESLYGVLIDSRQAKSQYCIIYMHGLSSNILEGASLISHLLPNTALFCFDFSGSGKSGGSHNTYGLKQHEDIPSVIALLEKQGYNNFILWGRSMGAVACLLHSFSQQSTSNVAMQVVDSPFCSFSTICTLYATKFSSIPEVLVATAVNILKQSFADHIFNPFKLQLLPLAIRCKTPTIFVYNEQDDVIPSTNTESIIKSLNSVCYYERISILDPHNHTRCKASLETIFKTIKKILKMEPPSLKGSRRKGFDVFSSYVKKKSAQGLLEKQLEIEERPFRRSAIYCSLSKKHSGYFSPKGPRKSTLNPEGRTLPTNF